MTWFFALFALGAVTVLTSFYYRTRDRREDDRAWGELLQYSNREILLFDKSMVAELPEPARRYFSYTIETGTPLYSVAEIEMTGELGLGPKDKPGYRTMHAEQILAPPYGLVWKLKTNLITGSDGITPAISWTRFWLFNLIPIVRVHANPNHHRSAFGRVVAEGAFWAPASLLPGPNVHWQELSKNSARAIVRYQKFEQSIDITVNDNGQPTRVVIQRWSNANPDKVFRLQPFGGDLYSFENFSGYYLPTLVEGGNHIGTEDYFPFYKANVVSIVFPTKMGKME